MKMYSIYDIAKHRLQWAKHLQRKNEELEAEVERLSKDNHLLTKAFMIAGDWVHMRLCYACNTVHHQGESMYDEYCASCGISFEGDEEE